MGAGARTGTGRGHGARAACLAAPVRTAAPPQGPLCPHRDPAVPQALRAASTTDAPHSNPDPPRTRPPLGRPVPCCPYAFRAPLSPRVSLPPPASHAGDAPRAAPGRGAGGTPGDTLARRWAPPARLLLQAARGRANAEAGGEAPPHPRCHRPFKEGEILHINKRGALGGGGTSLHRGELWGGREGGGTGGWTPK